MQPHWSQRVIAAPAGNEPGLQIERVDGEGARSISINSLGVIHVSD